MSLEGEITAPGLSNEDDDQEFNTLDEPVKETIVSTCKSMYIICISWIHVHVDKHKVYDKAYNNIYIYS